MWKKESTRDLTISWYKLLLVVERSGKRQENAHNVEEVSTTVVGCSITSSTQRSGSFHSWKESWLPSFLRLYSFCQCVCVCRFFLALLQHSKQQKEDSSDQISRHITTLLLPINLPTYCLGGFIWIRIGNSRRKRVKGKQLQLKEYLFSTDPWKRRIWLLIHRQIPCHLLHTMK